MDTNKFQDLFNKLNPEQKAAVELIEGPLMIVAGPGTGKTQVLILRVANILLKTQVDPSNILVLTFTENGASLIRRRLKDIIGRAAYYVNIFTFHGFCNDLIKNYNEEFQEFLSRKPANEINQINLIKNVISEARPKLLSPFGDPYFYVKEIIRVISDLKREAINSDEFLKILQEEKRDFDGISDLYYESGRYEGKMKGRYIDIKKQLDKNLELQTLYVLYGEKLKKAKLYDYDDMILEVLRVLEQDDDFLLRIQERFQYILVDEHQDTNNSQNQITQYLSSYYDNPNLFVVGDPKQAIFRFQGANLENFLYFKNLYLGSALVSLNKNYRSTQNILDLANSFIINNSLKISDLLRGVSEDLFSEIGAQSHPAEVYEFKRPETEYYFLAKKIASLINEGTKPEEIAVIYRENKDVFGISEMLSRYDIPYRIESSLNILENRDIRKLIFILKFLVSSDNQKLIEVLHMDFLNIKVLDVYKICNLLNTSVDLPLEILSNKEKLAEARIESVDSVFNLAQKLLNLRSAQYNLGLLDIFETVIREFGFLNFILTKTDSLESLRKLDALFSEAKRLIEEKPDSTLVDFLNHLDLLTEYNIPIKEKIGAYVPQAVRLMTAHGAKGLEFDYVFIVGAYDGHWGNRRNRNLIKLPQILGKPPHQTRNSLWCGGENLTDENDEERRLFYVAVTRARKMVYISYALRNISGREQFKTLFIEEMKKDLLRDGVADKYEKELEFNKEILFAPKINKGFSLLEKDYLNGLFEKRGLSATSLNNFLDCPFKFLYINLLRVPKASSRSQIYGKALHGALKDFFDRKAKFDEIGYEFLLEKFEEKLKKEPLVKSDFETVLEKGKAALLEYFKKYNGSWIINTCNEFRINKVYLPIKDGVVKLTGSLDKIEFLEDGLNVVDYKTGKPKSRNEILGQTKNSNGDYKRQLVFYKLLLDEYPVFDKKMISGEIDFVEVDKNGVFHKEKFIIENKEVEDLKKLIDEVSQKIIDLSFWNEGCGERECEYCRLKEMS